MIYLISIGLLIVGGSTAKDHEQMMFELINMHRVMLGYENLTTDGMLNQFTRGVAEKMAIGEEPFDHSGSRYRTKQVTYFLDWYQYGEVLGQAIGEGLSLEYAVFREWMLSERHKYVIENGMYNMLGVGYGYSEGKHLFVLIFLYVVEG